MLSFICINDSCTFEMLGDTFQGVQMAKDQHMVFIFHRDRFQGKTTTLTVVDSPACRMLLREEIGVVSKGTEVTSAMSYTYTSVV